MRGGHDNARRICGRHRSLETQPRRAAAGGFTTEEQTGGLVIRKYWNAPDMKIEKGGTYESVDQLRRDIANASKERGDKPTN